MVKRMDEWLLVRVFILYWAHSAEVFMDVSNIAGLSSSLSLTATNQAIGIAVLKRAINIESAGALALIAAIPTMTSANPPANLGRNIDIAV
jgi:Putative motility protein